MAYVLGHRPDEFGLVPDAEGFVRLKDLLRALSEEPGWGYVRKSHIHEVLITCRGDAFVTEDDRIKAVQPQESVSPVPGVVPLNSFITASGRRPILLSARKASAPWDNTMFFLRRPREWLCAWENGETQSLCWSPSRHNEPLRRAWHSSCRENSFTWWIICPLAIFRAHPFQREKGGHQIEKGGPFDTASPARELYPGHGTRPRASATRVKEKTCQKGDRLEEGCPEVRAKT